MAPSSRCHRWPGERARRANFVYGSSKAGMDTFFQGLGDSLVGSGVKVMIVRPGFVDTKMTKGLDAGSAVHHRRCGGRGHRARPGTRQRDGLGALDAPLRHVGAPARPPPDLPQTPDLTRGQTMAAQSERPVDATPLHTDDCRPRHSATGGFPRLRGSKRRGRCSTSVPTSTSRSSTTSGGSARGCCGVRVRHRAATRATSRSGPTIWVTTWTFRVFPDGSGEGEGPDGVVHHRFRTWKEALRDAGAAANGEPHDG